MDPRKRLEELAARFDNSKTFLLEGARVLAEAVGDALGVKIDEVAVLIVTTTGKSLRFVWPTALANSAAVFPAGHRDAFASSVLTTLKGKVDNKLFESKHLRFFESVKGMETSGLPIQKMMALPLIREKKAFGVIEVSRKGKTPDEAGPNFTQADAKKLVGLCSTLAPPLAKLIPEPFL